MIDRERFFEQVAGSLFPGGISPSQKDGMNAILDVWEKTGKTDRRMIGYILATIYHETDKHMQPVEEAYYVKDPLKRKAYLEKQKYYPFYGRDLVHTTWKANYERVNQFARVDVVKNPELIAEMPLAAEVAITFMLRGWYTGKKLNDYFNDTKEDWIWARSIINGKRRNEPLPDRAEDIASYGKKFFAAIHQKTEDDATTENKD